MRKKVWPPLVYTNAAESKIFMRVDTNVATEGCVIVATLKKTTMAKILIIFWLQFKQTFTHTYSYELNAVTIPKHFFTFPAVVHNFFYVGSCHQNIMKLKKLCLSPRVTRWDDLSPKGRQNEIRGDFFSRENRPFFWRQKGRFFSVKMSTFKL